MKIDKGEDTEAKSQALAQFKHPLMAFKLPRNDS